MNELQRIGTTWHLPARGGWVRDWQSWAPYAAVAWSLIYAALGLYWAVSGSGFPYVPGLGSDVSTGPVVGRFCCFQSPHRRRIRPGLSGGSNPV